MINIRSDHWAAYKAIVPEEKLIQSKVETFTVEGYNSLVRHFLARMKRKTKCYSKSKYMLELSLLLLMSKHNNQLSIFISNAIPHTSL